MAILFLRSVRRQHFSKTAVIFLSAVIASAVLGLIAIPASAENVTVGAVAGQNWPEAIALP
ncbi:MAG: hypothetical protein J4O05_10415, partial [Chloroflexi bacterium]|nr:hypothetical protein [Chloroflexota bacterium]